jgi:hypothetical protein
MRNWSELFPNGRTLFYEGKDPKGFRDEMLQKYKFDTKAPCPSIFGDVAKRWNKRDGYRFHCPAHCIDEVYGSGKYPLGS